MSRFRVSALLQAMLFQDCLHRPVRPNVCDVNIQCLSQLCIAKRVRKIDSAGLDEAFHSLIGFNDFCDKFIKPLFLFDEAEFCHLPDPGIDAPGLQLLENRISRLVLPHGIFPEDVKQGLDVDGSPDDTDGLSFEVIQG